MQKRSVFTIGHSTRDIETFLSLLREHGVEQLVDVRSIPRSRRHPQFNRENLPATLAAAGIEYKHQKGLGGLRRPRADSVNTGWHNDSFRGYADYMQTPEFEQNVLELIALAESRQVAVMCAEAVPWRCHRSLIADALLVRDVPVEHVMASPPRKPHSLTSFALRDGTKLTYPGPQPAFPF